jgi:hypothetical protein
MRGMVSVGCGSLAAGWLTVTTDGITPHASATVVAGVALLTVVAVGAVVAALWPWALGGAS